METLKIALVDNHNQIGGGQVALANLAKALSENGHEVHMILGVKNIDDRLANICPSRCFFHLVSGYGNLSDVPRLRGVIRKELSFLCRIHNFDVLHANGISGLFVPSDLRDSLAITLHGNNLYRGITLFRQVHANSHLREAILYDFRGLIRTFAGSFAYGVLEKIACERAKLVIALTRTEEDLAKIYYHLPEEQIRVVPNVISLPTEKERTYELPIRRNEKFFLSINALEMIKGIPLLVKAVEAILSEKKDVTYISVGDGPLKGMLQKLASKFPRRVIMIDSISEGIESVYARSTLLIHGSLYEALCLSIAEAMLSGKPVVAFNMASIPELVIDNVTGCLAKRLRPEDLADKVIDLLNDEKKARRMGSAAKKRIEELYAPKRVASQMENVYKEVLTS